MDNSAAIKNKKFHRIAFTKRLINQAIKYFLLLFVSFVMLIPIYWMIATALKPNDVLLAWPPRFIPNPISLSSFERIMRIMPVPRFLMNSLIVAAIVIVSNLIFCSLAAYTLARKQFRGSDFLFKMALGAMMVPVHVRVIPMYMLALELKIDNSYLGIAAPLMVTGFGIFLMRQFFSTLPRDIEDAAFIDGCNDWSVLFKIVMPMSRPAMASLAIFSFVWAFDDFLWPVILVNSVNLRPIQLGITLFMGYQVEDWGAVMACATVTAAPLLIMYLFIQDLFIEAMTHGAVKG